MTLRQLTLLLATCPLLIALYSEQDLILRSNVQMVEVSIVATGPHGASAEALEAKDLHVFDNGKPQTIVSFEKIGPVASAAGGLPPGTYSNRIGNAAQAQTVSMVLIDAVNSVFQGGYLAMRGVEEILDRIQPLERVAIYSFGAGFRVRTIHDFSSDKGSLRARLQAYRESGGSPDSPVRDSELWEPGLGHSLPGDRIRATMKALEYLADRVKGVPGRKNLIWVSAAFPIEIGKPGSLGHEVFAGPWKQTMTALSNAGVAVYPVDARGVTIDRKSFLNIGTMRDVAEATGGKAFYGSNDIGQEVRAALDDSRQTYILTYSPRPLVADGSYHKIRITTSRIDVHLRYRQGYNAADHEESGDPARADRLKELLASPLDASEIGVTATVESAVGPALHIVVHVDPADVNLTPNGGKWSGALRLEAMQLAASGDLLGGEQQTAEINLEQATYRRDLLSGMPFDVKIERAAGAVAVRIGVVDERGTHVGSVLVPLPPQGTRGE